MQTNSERRLWRQTGELRRSKRQSLGLTLGVVASRLGVSVPTVSRWERGRMRPNMTMERAWENALFKEVK